MALSRKYYEAFAEMVREIRRDYFNDRDPSRLDMPEEHLAKAVADVCSALGQNFNRSRFMAVALREEE